MSAQLRQSLQVTSTLSTLMLAPSAAHALMYVLTRQSHSHNGNANVNVNANRPKKWLSSCEGNHFLYTLYSILYTILLHRYHIIKLIPQLAVLLEASREV